MKFVNFWLLLLITTSLFSMEQAPIANFEITTMPDQTKTYKCLLCNYHPVSRESTFLTHWVKRHNETFDYTMEIWKETYFQCRECLTYYPSQAGLRCHIWRNHKNLGTAKKNAKAMESLERNAIFILHALANK